MCAGVAAVGRDGRSTRHRPLRRPLAAVSRRGARPGGGSGSNISRIPAKEHALGPHIRPPVAVKWLHPACGLFVVNFRRTGWSGWLAARARLQCRGSCVGSAQACVRDRVAAARRIAVAHRVSTLRTDLHRPWPVGAQCHRARPRRAPDRSRPLHLYGGRPRSFSRSSTSSAGSATSSDPSLTSRSGGWNALPRLPTTWASLLA